VVEHNDRQTNAESASLGSHSTERRHVLQNPLNQFIMGTNPCSLLPFVCAAAADDPESPRKLHRLVRTVTNANDFYEDLVQTALVYLSQKEDLDSAKPFALRMYRCRCHLIDGLRQGRSFDSFKRRHLRHEAADPGEVDETCWACLQHADPTREAISVSDLVAVLVKNLSELEASILDLRLRNFTLREISLELHISLSSVHAHCVHIAEIARECDLFC